MSDNKNKPAFPISYASTPMGDIYNSHADGLGGLSKREFAAIKAMQGLLADSEFSPLLTDEDMEEDENGQYKKSNEYWVQFQSGNTHRLKTTFEQRVAKVAVKYADALLAALEK